MPPPLPHAKDAERRGLGCAAMFLLACVVATILAFLFLKEIENGLDWEKNRFVEPRGQQLVPPQQIPAPIGNMPESGEPEAVDADPIRNAVRRYLREEDDVDEMAETKWDGPWRGGSVYVNEYAARFNLRLREGNWQPIARHLTAVRLRFRQRYRTGLIDSHMGASRDRMYYVDSEWHVVEIGEVYDYRLPGESLDWYKERMMSSAKTSEIVGDALREERIHHSGQKALKDLERMGK